MAPLADTLVHSLPWYFGVAVFAVWAAAAAGFTVLFRRLLRARADRRHAIQNPRHPRNPPPPIRDDRSLPPGGDLEPL
jgi:hypothetical protein